MVQEMPPDPELLSPAQAAARLGVSAQRVHAMVATGRLPARRIGSRLLIDRAAVEARAEAGAVPGRPFSPRRAWGILFLANGEPAAWLDPKTRWKLRSLLRQRGLSGLWPRLAARGTPHFLRAHPSDLARIAAEPGVMRTGAAAAAEVGIDLVASGSLDVYVGSPAFDELVRRYHLRPSRQPNLILRRLPPLDFRWPDRPVAPRSAVAVDLADDPDPRSRQVGQRVVADYGP